MRGIAMSAAGLAVAAVLTACAGASPQASSAATSAPPSSASSATSDATPAPTQAPTATPTTMSKAEAAARYRELADAYSASRKDLDKALNANSPSLKAIRAGATKATTGYQARVKGLIETSWPKDLQPYIDKYVDLSGYGLDTLNEAAHAKTLSDLVNAGDEADTRKLNAADAVIRTKLGLPLRTS